MEPVTTAWVPTLAATTMAHTARTNTRTSRLVGPTRAMATPRRTNTSVDRTTAAAGRDGRPRPPVPPAASSRDLATVAGSERRPLRVLLHDYGGYAFIAELARELARRGHDVHHVHYASLRSGKGSLRRQDDDPPSLSFGAIDP